MPPPEQIVGQNQYYIPRANEKNSSSIKDSKVSEMVVLTMSPFPLVLRLMKKMYESWRTAVDNCKANEAVLGIPFLFR